MIFIDKITKKSDLDKNDSLSTYDHRWSAQQNYKAFETFFYFIKEVKPSRILEIGTSIGGLTSFLNDSCKIIGVDCDILSYDINEHPWYKEMILNGIDVRIENVFTENYDDVDQHVKDFIKSDGITVVLCDGGNKKAEFNLLSQYLKVGDFILGHDYAYDATLFENEIYGKIWNWHELSESDIVEACMKNALVDYRRDVFQNIVWVCKMKSDEIVAQPNIKNIEAQTSNLGVTLVTGLWNINRSDLSDGWARTFEHYLIKFDELLKTKNNMIIFGDSELEDFVWERRSKNNTQYIIRDSIWFKSSVPYDKIQKIRNNPEWFNQSGWLVDSTQAKLEMYNPLVMSKCFYYMMLKLLIILILIIYFGLMLE